MRNWLTDKTGYYGSVAAIYLLTLLFAWYAFFPFMVPKRPVLAEENHKTLAAPPQPAAKQVIVTSGVPVRIVIPTLGIDLPVDPGRYNPTDNSWTLSGYHAQYAEMTALANNYGGNTFIYGHRNKYVFLYLYRLKTDDRVLVYTSNNHIFSYNFVSAETVAPDNTSILDYQGPPIMTIQTCTGNWNESRQMFKFDFAGVLQ